MIRPAYVSCPTGTSLSPSRRNTPWVVPISRVSSPARKNPGYTTPKVWSPPIRTRRSPSSRKTPLVVASNSAPSFAAWNALIASPFGTMPNDTAQVAPSAEPYAPSNSQSRPAIDRIRIPGRIRAPSKACLESNFASPPPLAFELLVGDAGGTSSDFVPLRPGGLSAGKSQGVIHSSVPPQHDLVARVPIRDPQVLLDGSGVCAQQACQQCRSDDDRSFHGILRCV